jgi:hypothetical protein
LRVSTKRWSARTAAANDGTTTSRIAAHAGVTERVRPMFGSWVVNGASADAPNGCSVPIANGDGAGFGAGVCAPAPAATNAIAAAATVEATTLSILGNSGRPRPRPRELGRR